MSKYRKRLQVGILLVIAVIGGLTLTANLFGDKSVAKTGDTAPAFSLVGLDGKTHNLSNYKGKTVVLNFWATYCEPCRNEMPALERQAAKWAGKDVVVLGINIAEGKVAVQSYVNQVGVTFPILFDQQETVRREYGVLNYPTTVFVKPNGKIDTIRVGEMDEAYIARTLESMLAGS